MAVEEEIVDWYQAKKSVYEMLTKKIESLIKEILEMDKIDYHSIQSRCKNEKSFKNKIDKGIDYDFKEMQDTLLV